MSQQALDLRRSVHIVRRHKILVGIVTVLGLLAGAGYAVLNPPELTSSALVVLPQAAAQSAQASASSPGSPGSDSYIATQVVIASSDPVLSAAQPGIRPAVSLSELQRAVAVKSVTNSILQITASGASAAQAEATANAVARGYISYVGSPGNGRVLANVLQPAINATRTAPVKRLLTYGLLGVLAGALIGFIVALAISREDRRLRERDEIASSIGVPVLASFPVNHPADAAAWARLMDDYRPGVVHAWQQRRLLLQLGLGEVLLGNDPDGSCSLTVLSLSSDRGALALGPQLAVFAASQGIPTALVVGPQQNEDATATLRTACGAQAPSSPNRPGHLHVTVYSGDDVHKPSDIALTVLVTVVDSRAPRVPDTLRTTTTMLGVSAGAATAEQLARVAMSAAADGREITGILVADPEPDDRTTGRVPRLAQPAHRRLPTRLSGTATEIRQ